RNKRYRQSVCVASSTRSPRHVHCTNGVPRWHCRDRDAKRRGEMSATSRPRGKRRHIVRQSVTQREDNCPVAPLEKSMWLRICRLPNRAIDGVTLDDFRIGGIVELGPQVASVFLAEGWAKPVLVRMERHIDASMPQRLLLVVDDDEPT